MLARPLLLWLLVLLSLLAGQARAQSPAFPTQGKRHIAAKLVAENPAPVPGEKLTIAFRMEPEQGWHGYWKNPGDAGKGMSVEWTLPSGWRVGELRYPVPSVLMLAGLMNHVFEGPYVVLADVTVPAGARPGEAITLRVSAQWLACTDQICVPEGAELALGLTVGAAIRPAENRTQFDEFRARLPQPLGGEARFALENGLLRLAIPFPRGAAIEKPWFFRADEGLKSYAGEQAFSRAGDWLVVETRTEEVKTGAVNGLLRIGEGRGLEIAARPGPVPQAGEPLEGIGAARGGSPRGVGFILLALGGALLGGLILNVMPCVFPILSLKAISLARAGGNERHARREALAYTAGVVLACLALGGALLGLRAGGMAVGWAFQLQNPVVILALFALTLAITLNLAGLFALGTIDAGGALADRGGVSGSFWTGGLVAFVATPCTGPFMAGALGAALVLPAPVALAIFAGLGLGLALPFLLIAYVPPIRARLPKPGAWMVRLQRWLALPMALTACALLWLLWRQTGGQGAALALAAGAAVAAACWFYGRSQRRGAPMLAPALALAVLALGAAGWALPEQKTQGAALAEGDAPFSEAALASARASGKPVFVYFTADWCLSCKVNEAAAIDREEVRAAFRQAGVQVLVGDWTNGDATIGRFLEAQGRSGVPLYLWYAPGATQPEVLPQILTPDMLTGRAR